MLSYTGSLRWVQGVRTLPRLLPIFAERWLFATNAGVTSMQSSGFFLKESLLQRNPEPCRNLDRKKDPGHEPHLARRGTSVVGIIRSLVHSRSRPGGAQAPSPAGSAGVDEARSLAGGHRIPAKATQADPLRQ